MSTPSLQLRWVEEVADHLRTHVSQRRTPVGLGVVVQDASGAIVAANDSACELLGLPWDVLVGRTSIDPRWGAVSERGLPLPGDQHPAMITLATGEAIAGFLMGLLIPAPVKAGEAAMGHTRWIEIATTPLFASASPGTASPQTPDGVLATFTDQSCTARAAAATEALLSAYRLLSEATPGPVLRTDADGTVVQLAAVASDDSSVVLGQSLRERIHPDDLDAFTSFWSAVTTGSGAPRRIECRLLADEGDHRWTLLHANPIHDADGSVSGVTVSLHDVHDAVLTRELLRAAEDALDRQRT